MQLFFTLVHHVRRRRPSVSLVFLLVQKGRFSCRPRGSVDAQTCQKCLDEQFNLESYLMTQHKNSRQVKNTTKAGGFFENDFLGGGAHWVSHYGPHPSIVVWVSLTLPLDGPPPPGAPTLWSMPGLEPSTLGFGAQRPSGRSHRRPLT